jgi:hypothetical protein
VAQLRLAPSSSRGASPDITIQDAGDDALCGKKRRKQRRQETATKTNDHSDINKKASGSDTGHTTAVVDSSKHQV